MVENCRPGNTATGVPSYHSHCNRIIGTGKAIWECGATWRIWLNDQTISGLKYDAHTNIHGDPTSCFDVIISALLQDYRKMTYTPCLYGGRRSFSIIIQLTKYGGHTERWFAINNVALGFDIFLPAAERLSCKQLLASLSYQKMKYTNPISPTSLYECSTNPNQICDSWDYIVFDFSNSFMLWNSKPPFENLKILPKIVFCNPR